MGSVEERALPGSANAAAVAVSSKDVESASAGGPDNSSTSSDVVDWDGPDDPQNPHNWSEKDKVSAVAIVSLITFITPLASSIFAPSIEEVMKEFKSTSSLLSSFIVSVYLIGYCFGPLVIAPLSEMYGRSPLYHVCNVLFVIFSVACALAPNMAALIVFRLLSGLAGSCPLTLGAGTLADMIGPEKRAMAMSWWICGPLLGPVIGPIAGGYLSQAKGWRWSFWVVAMAAGSVTIAAILFLRESYAYTILDRKTKKLRKETGNQNLRSALDTGRSPKSIFRLAIVRPTKMLLFSPIVSLLSCYMAILYGYLYLIFTILPIKFEEQYHFNPGDVGLTYLGTGVGSAIGLFVNAMVSDRLAIRFRQKNGGDHQPEYRLPPMMFACFLVPIGLFWFGWTADFNKHWILPIVGTGIFGLGTVIVFMAIQVYLVDAFSVFAASATAASTVFRSLLGALLPLGGRDLFTNLGMGWGSSLLGFLALAMTPIPFLFYRYGERVRKTRFFNVEL